ncbi:L-histidine N(alpha)-methyltransferase [Arcticibacter eurypsychrophilus]|uniref:L-histidine N(alpha)-methyltransferase n=1 Tax=Arcticibacter eurypsychrophilus TaxID=1434752 RepID=UPI00084D726B|nr:L-histidine N(alpha)-methyltransferase [Arcticibacter eurypsychrophilus]
MNTETESSPETYVLPEQLKVDVLTGLLASPKYMHAKYFYDAKGDELFRQIMKIPEYYLTDCEMEIFKDRCMDILHTLSIFPNGFDLIELGAGDAIKSSELLKCLVHNDINFTYYPIDISGNVIQLLHDELPKRIPGINLQGIQAEYFEGLKEVVSRSDRPKLILLLGGNIGNMPPDEALEFCTLLRDHLAEGDFLLIGFDLKKDPWVIFNAYNDHQGITEQFNLNLLTRLNRELGADFNLQNFRHYESYDPETGSCKSYLFSKTKQTVQIAGEQIIFEENECIFTETSHKYSLKEVDQFASKSGFEPVLHLMDSKKWFTDVIWKAV